MENAAAPQARNRFLDRASPAGAGVNGTAMCGAGAGGVKSNQGSRGAVAVRVGFGTVTASSSALPGSSRGSAWEAGRGCGISGCTNCASSAASSPNTLSNSRGAASSAGRVAGAGGSGATRCRHTPVAARGRADGAFDAGARTGAPCSRFGLPAGLEVGGNNAALSPMSSSNCVFMIPTHVSIPKVELSVLSKLAQRSL